MSYVKRIRALREAHNYTQKYITKVLGTSQSMYAHCERASDKLPIHYLLTLCGPYHISSDYILGLAECSRPNPLTAYHALS